MKYFVSFVRHEYFVFMKYHDLQKSPHRSIGSKGGNVAIAIDFVGCFRFAPTSSLEPLSLGPGSRTRTSLGSLDVPWDVGRPVRVV